MARTIVLYSFFALALAVLCLASTWSSAEPMTPPHAPAKVSWLPHGYGRTMHIFNCLHRRKKGVHGFRNTPSHTGCVSQPMWGWDVNGFYKGPQTLEVDPVECQLPIGLIYPDHGPPLPPPRPRNVRRRAMRPQAPIHYPPRRY